MLDDQKTPGDSGCSYLSAVLKQLATQYQIDGVALQRPERLRGYSENANNSESSARVVPFGSERTSISYSEALSLDSEDHWSTSAGASSYARQKDNGVPLASSEISPLANNSDFEMHENVPLSLTGTDIFAVGDSQWLREFMFLNPETATFLGQTPQ
jgi:hypothetical protein